MIILQDCPLGGKLEGCRVPSFESRMNVKVFRPVHVPFQLLRRSKSSVLDISGIQKPEAYSLASASVRCLSVPSRVLASRPGRRSSWSVWISSE